MGATRPAGKMQCSYTNKGSQTALITRLMCLRLSARGTRRPIRGSVWCLRPFAWLRFTEQL